jgi:hypothetical protein
MEALSSTEAVGLWVAIDLMGRNTLGSQMDNWADEAEEVGGANEAKGVDEANGANVMRLMGLVS